jgi:hypothetical protein
MSEKIEDLINEILSAPEYFDKYMEELKIRRTRIREWRRRESDLIRMREELGNEFQLSLDDGDDEIACELRLIIEACETKIELHRQNKPVSISLFSSGISQANDGSTEKLDVSSKSSEEIVKECASLGKQEDFQDNRNATDMDLKQTDEVGKSAEVPMGTNNPELSDVESAELIEKSRNIFAKWEGVKGSLVLDDNMEVDRDALLETKEIKCMLNGLQVCSLNPETEAILAQVSLEMSDLLSRVQVSEEKFPFSHLDLTAKEWEKFAERYRNLISAWKAMDWYVEHYDLLEQNTRGDLLNSIAASQKLLFRRLTEIKQFDDIQEKLFKLVSKYNDTAGFLAALQENTLDKNLATKESLLGRNWEKGKKQYEDKRASQERAKRKEEAIQAVVKWEEERAGRLVTESSEEKDRQELCALLDDCLDANVPPSCTKLREAILVYAPVLLEGMPKYAKFLEYVQKERKRRGLDETVEKEPDGMMEVSTDEELERMKMRLQPYVTGKKILMIGGKARQYVADEIENLLNCKCEWKDSEKGDKSKKFFTDISHAHILLILKNLVSHEICEKGREWIETNKGHWVILTAGYGVKQILHSLDMHFTARPA